MWIPWGVGTRRTRAEGYENQFSNNSDLVQLSRNWTRKTISCYEERQTERERQRERQKETERERVVVVGGDYDTRQIIAYRPRNLWFVSLIMLSP